MNLEAQGAGVPAHEIVYRRLRAMVLYGDLAPGQPVTIQGLVARMGAGMTPVREAMRRLTAEGALQALGNRRIAVPVLDARALSELTEARLALEPLLAARAAANAGNAGLQALEAIDGQLDEAIARGDIGGYLRHNHAFHAGLNAMAEAPILAGLTETLWLRFGPSLRVVCGRVGTAHLPDRHKDLIAALRASDAAAAASALRGDVEQGMAMIARSL
jgi:DNA-binding GntR family transcriptional regulator